MAIGNTTGSQKASHKEAFAVGVLEVNMPNTGTAVAGAVTLNQGAGFITSEALTTAIGLIYTLTLTNSFIDANTMIFATSQLGTSTQGTPDVTTTLDGAGSATIKVKNIDAANAFNGTIVIGFFLVRKASLPL
jgi:hypothetical protein